MDRVGCPGKNAAIARNPAASSCTATVLRQANFATIAHVQAVATLLSVGRFPSFQDPCMCNTIGHIWYGSRPAASSSLQAGACA